MGKNVRIVRNFLFSLNFECCSCKQRLKYLNNLILRHIPVFLSAVLKNFCKNVQGNVTGEVEDRASVNSER